MIFTQTTEQNGSITIDGYSNAKTMKQALKELQTEVAKYSALEASAIMDNLEVVNQDTQHAEYFIQCEPVGCASIEIHDQMKYKEANWYLAMKFTN